MLLCNHLNKSDQVLLLRCLQLGHHCCKAAQVMVDSEWLFGVD